MLFHLSVYYCMLRRHGCPEARWCDLADGHATWPSRECQQKDQNKVAEFFFRPDRRDVLGWSNQVWDAAGTAGLSSTQGRKIRPRVRILCVYKVCRNYHDNNDDNGNTANGNSNTVICTSNAVLGHNKLKTNRLWYIIILGTSMQDTRELQKQKRIFRIIICSKYRAHIGFLFKTNCCMKVYYKSMA